MALTMPPDDFPALTTRPFLWSANPAVWRVPGLDQDFRTRRDALRAEAKLPPHTVGRFLSPGAARALEHKRTAKERLEAALQPKVRRIGRRSRVED